MGVSFCAHARDSATMMDAASPAVCQCDTLLRPRLTTTIRDQSAGTRFPNSSFCRDPARGGGGVLVEVRTVSPSPCSTCSVLSGGPWDRRAPEVTQQHLSRTQVGGHTAVCVRQQQEHAAVAPSHTRVSWRGVEQLVSTPQASVESHEGLLSARKHPPVLPSPRKHHTSSKRAHDLSGAAECWTILARSTLAR